MKLADAEEIAYDLTQAIAPFCERVQVAGSIRRRKAEVKDVEIVAITEWRWRDGEQTLFGAEPEAVNLLYENRAAFGECQWIKTGTHEIIPWQPKPEGKYWRGLLPAGIKLDLFLCDRDNWGWIFAIRTGSAEFSHALLAHANRLGYHSDKGRLCRGDEQIRTAEEGDVFRILKLAFVPPELRHNESSLRKVK